MGIPSTFYIYNAELFYVFFEVKLYLLNAPLWHLAPEAIILSIMPPFLLNYKYTVVTIIIYKVINDLQYCYL